MRKRNTTTRFVFVWPVLAWSCAALAASVPARAEGPDAGNESAPGPASAPQVPVALAWGPGEILYVAVRDARRVLAVDPRDWTVAAGFDLTIRPSSMALADDRSTLLLGGIDGRFVALDATGRVVRDLAVGRGPTRVLPLPGGRAAVTSRWDRSLRVIDWRGGRILAEHPLGFAPGALVRRPDGRVVVADAFGGRFADLSPCDLGSGRDFAIDGVNLLALAISGDGKELLIAHMFQEEEVPITEANIDRGHVLSSRLGAIRLADLDDRDDRDEGPRDSPRQPPLRSLTLDGPVHGAADPAAMAISPDGTKVVIALAGAHQLLLNDRSRGDTPRGAEDLLPLGHNQRIGVVAVGRNPSDVVLDPTGTLAVTADAMSDTLTVIRIADRARVAQVRLGPRPPARDAVRRGEAAFHDGRRALDGWMSCASCHRDGHTNGLNFDTFGDRGFGAAKNTPSLLGVRATGPFTWAGTFDHLADQVRQSFETSLRGPNPDPGVVDDLVAYLESLPPPPPRRSPDDPAARRGAEVFRGRRCQTCHESPLYTIAATRDVGLVDRAGRHRFNPPTLRGVAWSAPYLHDGRAATLADVLMDHPPGKSDPLDARDRDDLIAFLESL